MGASERADDPRERLLAAAARYFRSPAYGVLSDIAVKRIAADAGMSEAQARRYFLVEELHEELVRYLLTPGPRSGRSLGP